MPTWTRKLTWRDRSDDWRVCRDGFVVGRVRYDRSLSDMQPAKWSWSTLTIPARNGFATTLDEGLECIRAAATDKWSHKPYR